MSKLIYNSCRKFVKNLVLVRFFSQAKPIPQDALVCPGYLHFGNSFVLPDRQKEMGEFLKGVVVHNDFITVDEENSILKEIEPYLKRMRYEFDHWDDAIHGYRETERLDWKEENKKILNRVRDIAFPPGVAQIKTVHILDLDKKGYIKPHIDAIRFCGDTIAGLSLLTDSVMRFVHEKNKDLVVDVLLKRRSLYILKHDPRYLYTHEILKNEESSFQGRKVEKGRRISVICRNEPLSPPEEE